MGWFDDAGKNYSDKSKPTGYGSGGSSPKVKMKFSVEEQARARRLIKSGMSREAALRVILDERL
jgi:hypothetical protein